MFKFLFKLITPIIFGVLFFNLIYYFMTGNTISLTSLLNSFLQVETFSFNFSFSSLLIVEEWAILDGLRQFINTLISILDFALYVVETGITALKFIFSFEWLILG